MCHMDASRFSSALQPPPFTRNDSWPDTIWTSPHAVRHHRTRFQQRQLQEKEEKLVRLYEEQQERALKSVGSRSQSGGSSVSSSSSVGVGKVRHMFQSRREDSEPRIGAAITGRDKSHPLEPLTNHSNARRHDERRHSAARPPATWAPTHHDRSDRSLSLDRNHNCHHFLQDENSNREDLPVGKTVRRTQSQTRSSPRWETAGRSGNGSDGSSFRLVDEYWWRYPGRGRESSDRGGRSEEGVSRGKVSLGERSRMEGRFRSYVSEGGLGKKGSVGNGTVGSGRSGVGGRLTTGGKESSSSGYLNGSVSSPVRKIRKPTPVPLSVAPPQHLLQKETRKTTRIETIREVPSSVSSPKTLPPRTHTLTRSVQKPTTPAKTLPSTRIPSTKTTSPAPPRSTAPPPGLVNCRICGRHFATDRVSKHEEVCQKSSRNKRKPFDALQQRVKGTEVEQFIKKTTKLSRAQPEKVAKPQSNWRKKHEEFINNIRAAKEVSAHLKKGGKLSDLPPPPPSDYSDYVPCPHCARKFNASAAERHIPKCANIINNKPKPNLHKTTPLKQTSKLLHPAPNSFRGRK